MATNNNNNYKEYTVKVYNDGTKYWYLNGNLHREDGPAIEYPDGYKEWYLNGKEYTEAQWKKEIVKIKNKNSCDGRIVEIDGKKYKLIETN